MKGRDLLIDILYKQDKYSLRVRFVRAAIFLENQETEYLITVVIFIYYSAARQTIATYKK